ncbi:MAG TPA: hypothetical protein VL727_22520 [Puia sp.]|nr:hypothetical protein [Puia sp.]
MKSAFLLLACLGAALLTYAQVCRSAVDQNRVTITASNNNLSISSQGHTAIVRSNEALDSCLQKILPGLDHPSILLETPNDMDPERSRTIAVILEKFHCPVMRFRKFEPVNARPNPPGLTNP